MPSASQVQSCISSRIALPFGRHASWDAFRPKSLPQDWRPSAAAAHQLGGQSWDRGIHKPGALKTMSSYSSSSSSSSKSLGIKCHFAFRDKLANLTRKLFISSLLSAKEFFLHFFSFAPSIIASQLPAFSWHLLRVSVCSEIGSERPLPFHPSFP